MKTLFELCRPRDSVFDEGKRDDVLDLTDLAENRIIPAEFFEENFVTEGMKLLIDTAFKRFRRRSQTGIIKLTQAMGGGKTHNMIALGLLARQPNLMGKVMGEGVPGDTDGPVKVVAFTGRESDAPYGIWGAIAEQLGKKELFKDYYSPLSAPGQTAWIHLLRAEPVLILLDELPPYLENARSKTIGNSDLSVVTINALANLFAALGKDELSNVCLVISDLKATYESGSEMLQASFKDLENEINRSALNIEPVGSGSDEVYHILEKRLFANLPDETDVVDIAKAYKEAVLEAKQMGYTNMSPEQIFVGVRDAFPFHPSIKDLYARFKENPGFQQTRGLIRLMRMIVAQLYSGDNPPAKSRQLINVFDFELNDRSLLTVVSQIKPSLTNAISHDIASNGRAIAEVVDAELNQTVMCELSKLLLVASMADVPNALLGLTLQDTIGYLCQPGKDITQVKKALDDFIMKAWYLYTDRDGRLFFKNTKNMIAEINTLVDSYDKEIAKKELKGFLKKIFEPTLGDCYQGVQVFPAVDEIGISDDKINLVLFEPYTEGGLHPDLSAFYENTRLKNRIMFLSGRRNTMDNLIRTAKERKAVQVIISRMKDEKVPENNPQFEKATDKLHKVTLNLLQAARETFLTLFYPGKKTVMSADFLMEFSDNNYNGEKQIRAVLLQRQKFTEDITGDTFRRKCEDRLFTQKEMRWNDIKARAAANPAWQWHLPRALDDLKDDMLKRDVWRESGGYVEKPPFPREDTDVIIQELNRDSETGEVTLKLTPRYGNRILYEIASPATEASLPVENPQQFKTHELVLYFLCVDTTKEHTTGKPQKWTNKITLQYRTYDKGTDLMAELKSAPSAPIRYSTDGSNPKLHGGIYEGEFAVPESSTHILAVAEKEEIYSETLTIRIDREKPGPIDIDPQKPIRLSGRVKTNDTADTYEVLGRFKKHGAVLSEVIVTFYRTDEKTNEKGWIELSIDQYTPVEPEKLEQQMESIRDNFMNMGKVTISIEYASARFKTGEHFLDWVAENKLSLKDFKEGQLIQ